MTEASTSADAVQRGFGDGTPEVGVFCQRCKRKSRDKEFCEHCQAELIECEAPIPAGDGSNKVWSFGSLVVRWPDDPCVSFSLNVGNQHYRVRGIRPELWPGFEGEVRTRQSAVLRALPPIHLLESGGGALILAEVWQPESNDSVEAGACNVDDLLVDTLHRCRQLSGAMAELHESGNVWLEFDPDSVEIKGKDLRITNLDWRLFPSGRCPTRLAKISPKYSPPELCQFRDELIGPRTDVFHLALAAYYRLAGLKTNGIAGRGLESFGFDLPALRVFRPNLPTGIWPVLRRALSINSDRRPASVKELIGQLENGVEKYALRSKSGRKQHQQSSQGKSLLQRMFDRFSSNSKGNSLPDLGRRSEIDVGWQTIAGRAKSALGSINQDCVVVQWDRVGDRDILLMIVADGVTQAKVGTGDRASHLACEVIVASVRQQIRSVSRDGTPAWAEVLDRACQSATEAILVDALATPNRPKQFKDSDLMSTTAIVGVLDGSNLYLANVGDSRVYLVANDVAEQLTVDGDVASSQIAHGTPPEQVQELGIAGKALRCCLGACRETENGNVVAELERAHPQVTCWQLKPGETFVLCSDGLVEEGVFLEPEDLVRITDANRHLTSQVLAERLVESANEKQRLPSSNEPNGYGDNIACIVLRTAATLPNHDTPSRKG